MVSGIDRGEADGAGPGGLADRLRLHTSDLHREAETTGIVADILQGRINRPGYALFLRNLLPAYEAIEAALTSQRAHPALSGIADPAVFRSASLAADLRALHGTDWRGGIPVLPEAEDYARRVEAVADVAHAGPEGLLAHAYVRYLGDLNGGRALRSLVSRRLDLGPDALHFYDFPAVADLEAFRCGYRARFDAASSRLADRQRAEAEAAEAFRRNIAVSRAVAAAVRAG